MVFVKHSNIRHHEGEMDLDPVMRLRDAYPGSRIRLFSNPVPGTRIHNKEFKYFKPKNLALGYIIRVVHPGPRPGSRILILIFYPSRILIRNTV
jgi:hypothetical protein